MESYVLFVELSQAILAFCFGLRARKTVVPYNDSHKEILLEIARIGDRIKQKFATTPITRQLFQQIRTREVNAFRNNEGGDYCEFLIKDIYSTDKALFKHAKNVKHLRGKGYRARVPKSVLARHYTDFSPQKLGDLREK